MVLRVSVVVVLCVVLLLTIAMNGVTAASINRLKGGIIQQQQLRSTTTDSDSDVVSFVEVESDLSFSPEDAAEHKSAQIGLMRSKRVRAQRINNKRMTKSTSRDPRKGGEEPDHYGPHDERTKSEEARVFSASTNRALDAERKQRLGSVRPVGVTRAPFCPTYPFCQQMPPPPQLNPNPPLENPALAKQEMIKLDPMKFLPQKLEELKKDPMRFGIVFQDIYTRNGHNEKLRSPMKGK